MGFANIGIPGAILIVVILLVMFGPSRLPEIGRAFGQTLSEFKKGTQEMIESHDEEVEEK